MPAIAGSRVDVGYIRFIHIFLLTPRVRSAADTDMFQHHSPNAGLILQAFQHRGPVVYPRIVSMDVDVCYVHTCLHEFERFNVQTAQKG
jgi:hypothetical protein